MPGIIFQQKKFLLSLKIFENLTYLDATFDR